MRVSQGIIHLVSTKKCSENENLRNVSFSGNLYENSEPFKA